MDKLTAIKIKYDDGTYSDEIPISVLSENVEWDNTHTLVDVLGSIDVDITGTIQDQISQLFNEKVSNSDMQAYVTNSMPAYITSWLNTNVNPVGSAVVVDSSLTVSGAAADAKVVGDKVVDLNDLKNALTTIEKVYTLADCDSSDIKYINYNDGRLVTSGSWRTYFFKNNDNNAFSVSCTVASTDRGVYTIAFYGEGEPSANTFISGVRANAGTNSYSASVPANCKTIAISNRTASLDSPVGNVEKTLPIINQNDINKIKEQMLTDYEVGISGAYDTQAVYITASDDSNNGKITRGASYQTYFYKNIGYTNIICELLLLTGDAAIAFYNDNTLGTDTCISTVPCSITGSKRTYTATVPDGCKVIAICNRSAALASPTIKLYITPGTAQELGIDAYLLSSKNNEKIQEIVDGDSDDINYLNSDIKYIVQSSSAIYGVNYSKTQHDYFTVLHGSDFHNDKANFKRMMEFAKANEGMIDCVFITGDLKMHWAETNDGWLLSYGTYYQDAGCPVLPVIGNHEVGYSPAVESIGGVANTIANIDAKFITPYMEANGCTQGNNGGYYYKDFNDYNIRVIALNEYEMPRIINPNDNTKYLYDYWKRYLSQDQATWFVNTLNSVPENYSVIVIMHQMPDKINEYTENKFDSDIVIGADSYDNAQGNIVQDIIDAYISKTTLSHTYVNTISAPSSDVPNVTVNADFTNANGDFIAYIAGHTHYDKIGESSQSTNKQLAVVVTTSGTTKQQNDDLWRQIGTKSQDCFNLYVFDTRKKKIRILRIGANTTLDMEQRDMTSVSYAQS